MNDSAEFDERDKITARNFGHVTKKSNVERIIYFGWIG
jgi:hypothetical protein